MSDVHAANPPRLSDQSWKEFWRGFARLAIAVVAVVLIIWLGLATWNWAFGKSAQVGEPAEALRTLNRAPASASTPSGGAPVVGSKLPNNMVPGEWYATGNSKTVPAGTNFETGPRDCVRGGIPGKCGWKKRGG